MLFRHLRFLMLLPFLVLQQNPPAGDPPAGDPPAGDPPKNDPPASDQPLGENGEKALKAERDARKDAETRAKTAEDELYKLRKAAKKREDAEAEAQGEWQKLAETREADLKTANDTITSQTATLDQLSAYVKADIASVHKAVKDAAKDAPAASVLLSFHPGDDADTTDLIAWTAKAKAQLPDLTVKERKPGHPKDPDSDPDKEPEIPSAVPKHRLFG